MPKYTVTVKGGRPGHEYTDQFNVTAANAKAARSVVPLDEGEEVISVVGGWLPGAPEIPDYET